MLLVNWNREVMNQVSGLTESEASRPAEGWTRPTIIAGAYIKHKIWGSLVSLTYAYCPQILCNITFVIWRIIWKICNIYAPAIIVGLVQPSADRDASDSVRPLTSFIFWGYP